MLKDQRFHSFQSDVSHIILPEKFTFPFYYEPHPITVIAANELQDYLENQKDWKHNFGLNEEGEGLIIGKMFGVLVVKNAENELGYLVAFSGKLAGVNHHKYFVPPIFDMLEEESFFRKEEEILNNINKEIEDLENASEIKNLKSKYEKANENYKNELALLKVQIKKSKNQRKNIREENNGEAALFETLRKESIKEQFYLKDFNRKWKLELEKIQQEIENYNQTIDLLKEERKIKSAQLQNKLFDQYHFLDANGESRNVADIFDEHIGQLPPAGAGECAAPKLLQYAYQNKYQPIALAEFWWGQSPKSEIRVHKNFYPSCRGKCEPILGHMLKGLQVDENPMLSTSGNQDDVSVIYEDECMIIINKPAEFLSVPGKSIKSSVYYWVKKYCPEASGPLIVHRLDMSTSGLMMIAKNKETHYYLQSQFIKRTIQKRYVAVLGKKLKEETGEINLPLRVDLNDRPRQLVCYEHGKASKTKWEVIKREEGKTWVYFYPLTGRTHQLRVHAAHHLGLNAPIVGDDIYGEKENRLHLHAQYLKFKHPIFKQMIEIEKNPDF